MVGLAIALLLGFPIVFLAIGFLGVSKKRAIESREHLEPQLAASKENTAEAVQPSTEPALRPVNPTVLPPLDPTQGGATG